MTRFRAPNVVLTLLIAALAACTSAPEEPAVGETVPSAVEWRSAPTRDGETQVRWRPVGGELVSNRMTTVEIELTDAEGPVTGATVAFDAFMPDHGHGTNLVPRTTELGEGRYRVEGVLLHMTGFWELRVDVVRDGVASRVTFDLEL